MTIKTEIDPFTPAPQGCYTDNLISVTRRGSLRPAPGEQWLANTGHFLIGRSGGRLAVVHALPPDEIDDDLTALVRRELIDPGWIYGADSFERIFTGIVLTSRPDPDDAWELFYRNTLDRLDSSAARSEGSLGQYAEIYRHAEALFSGSLLDLGSCFGFFPLRARQRGHRVLVGDVRPGTCELISRLSARLDLPLPVLCCDAAAVPAPDGCVDTVTMLHLLEHVDEAHGRRMVEEALRLARRQVIVAVPLETEADACFDHVRTLSLADLAALGAAAGRPYDVHEHEGGWLVISR